MVVRFFLIATFSLVFCLPVNSGEGKLWWDVPFLPFKITLDKDGFGIEAEASIDLGVFGDVGYTYDFNDSKSPTGDQIKYVEIEVLKEVPKYIDREVVKYKTVVKVVEKIVVKEVIKEILIRDDSYYVMFNDRNVPERNMAFLIKGVAKCHVELSGITTFTAERGKIVVDITDAKINEFKFRGNLSGREDLDFRWKIQPQFFEASNFNEGIAQVINENSKIRYIRFDDSFNGFSYINDEAYRNGSHFYNGYAKVVTDNYSSSWEIISKSGGWVQEFSIHPQRSVFVQCEKGLCSWFKDGDIFEYHLLLYDPVIGYSWKVDLEKGIDEMRNFSEGLAPAKVNDLWGFINTKGEMVIPPRFTEVKYFTEGRCFVQINGKYRCIDQSGNYVFTNEFTSVEPYHEGLAAAAQNYNWGFITLQGDWRVAPKFQHVESFNDGMAAVMLNNPTKWGYINLNGELVIPAIYREVKSFSEGLAPVRDEKTYKWGYINKKGKWLHPPIFLKAFGFYDGLAVVKDGERYGYLECYSPYMEK